MGSANNVIPTPLLSVVMPVFNERTTIEEIVSRVVALGVLLKYRFTE